jgi:hypothetical protein
MTTHCEHMYGCQLLISVIVHIVGRTTVETEHVQDWYGRSHRLQVEFEGKK